MDAAHPTRSGLLVVQRGLIKGPRGVVVGDIAFHLRPACSVVLLGPVGSGKSALMRALTGQPDAPGFRRSGSWTLRDVQLPTDAVDAEVRWLPQSRYRKPHEHESFRRPPAVSNWRDGLSGGPIVAFLDEPDSDATDLDAIAAGIREFARTGLVVTITHNVEFARAIADEVLFIGDGRMQLHLPAAEFFNSTTREAQQ